MEITTIKYANAEQTLLLVNGNISVPWPCSTWHNELIQEWLDVPNTIEAYQTSAEELIEAQELKKKAIEVERENKKYADISYSSNTYSVSDWDITMIRTLLDDARNSVALPTGDYWRTATNTNVALTQTDLENLNDLIRTQIQDAYEWSWTKKAEVDACTTVAEVDAITLV